MHLYVFICHKRHSTGSSNTLSRNSWRMLSHNDDGQPPCQRAPLRNRRKTVRNHDASQLERLSRKSVCSRKKGFCKMTNQSETTKEKKKKKKQKNICINRRSISVRVSPTVSQAGLQWFTVQFSTAPVSVSIKSPILTSCNNFFCFITNVPTPTPRHPPPPSPYLINQLPAACIIHSVIQAYFTLAGSQSKWTIIFAFCSFKQTDEENGGRFSASS